MSAADCNRAHKGCWWCTGCPAMHIGYSNDIFHDYNLGNNSLEPKILPRLYFLPIGPSNTIFHDYNFTIFLSCLGTFYKQILHNSVFFWERPLIFWQKTQFLWGDEGNGTVPVLYSFLRCFSSLFPKTCPTLEPGQCTFCIGSLRFANLRCEKVSSTL